MVSQRPGAFRTRSGEANLVVCLVAFMDLLGVKAMTKLPYRQELARLRSLDTTMRDVLAIGKPTDFRTSTFSDSIAIVLPLPRGGTDQANALRQLLLRCADLQLSLASKGFFLRGGVTVGRYFHAEHMVYGAGLVEAWMLENKKAVNPRILIDRDSDEIREIVNQPRFGRQRQELLTCDHDGSVFLDYLASAPLYSQLSDNPSLDFFSNHKKVITSRLAAHKDDAATWQKYRWVAEYHNAAVATLMGKAKAKSLTISDGAGIARKFEIVKKLEPSAP